LTARLRRARPHGDCMKFDHNIVPPFVIMLLFARGAIG
jgi:hypothetical protein